MSNDTDRIDARELELSPLEQRAGVVHVMAMTYRRAAVVYVEGNDGIVVWGRAVLWPDQEFDAERLVYFARGNAHRKLARARASRVQFLEDKARRAKAALLEARAANLKHAGEIAAGAELAAAE
jgi:hypothetical protein